MADVETPAAESSPAAPATTESTPATNPVSVPTDPEAYAEWRQTGKLPGDAKPSKREAAASSKSVDSESEKDASVSENDAPVSETGNKGRENAEARIRRLVSERDSYKSRLEALEAGKKDVNAESSPAPAKNAKADPSTAPETPQRPVKPKQEDFDDWTAYEAAQDKYVEDLADFKAAKRLEEHVQRQRQENLTQEMQKRLDDARERYGTEAEATITGTAKTVFGDEKVAPALKAAIGRSDVIVDALYVMGSDAEEFSRFLDLCKKDPLEALRKWFTVEGLVREELKSGKRASAPETGSTPARGPDGKFLPEKAEKPAKREAPSPPRELNGNAAPPGDERERAAKANDFRAFKADADRRDMQRFKGV
jgi:hypothetical protein